MCGRLTQPNSRTEHERLEEWMEANLNPWTDIPPNYNVAPGSRPLVLHRLHGDRPEIDSMHWGYRPAWAVEKRIPMAINARIEKAMTSSYFRHMWRSGRVIVPAGGWYEWTGEKGRKQPWYIRLKEDTPMLLAAITNWHPGKESSPESGLVIVTAAADAGMVDVHDRRPVVLAPEDARLWLDPDLPMEQAEQLARMMSLPADDFKWHPVGTEVNNARHNGAHLIEPAAALL